jgi:membrane protein
VNERTEEKRLDLRRRPRGRDATAPIDIPALGWRDIALRVKENMARDNVSLIAAGLALYALLAAFPALAAIVSIYGLFASPTQIADQLQSIAGVLPGETTQIISDALEGIASQRGGTLTFGALVSFIVALWSARKGMVALMTATNIAFDETETRSLVRQVLVSLGFTAGAVAGFVVVVLLAVAAPIAAEALGLSGGLRAVLAVLRWLILWLFVAGALAAIYRFAPARNRAKWRWVHWGAAVGATLWLVGSLLFSLYVGNFGSYGETYGALGGVVVLLLWFYLTGFIVVIGAEVNAEMEHQTARDTTRGPPKPMGRRGARVADTLGHTP